MGIASTISLPSPGWWKLNAIYLFNLTLILLFLILPAITGPATKLWWMTITYSTPGVKGEAGESSWEMGGLGVCKSGEECTGAGSSMAPAISGQIKSVLMYHFAVATMVFLIAVAQLILIPRQKASAWKGWTTFFLPIFATLLVISVMGVDLIVRAHLMKDKSIGQVQTEGVFWLSVSAAISSLFWSYSALRLRQVKYNETGEELKAKRVRKAEKQMKREAEAEAKRQEAKDKTLFEWLCPWKL